MNPERTIFCPAKRAVFRRRPVRTPRVRNRRRATTSVLRAFYPSECVTTAIPTAQILQKEKIAKSYHSNFQLTADTARTNCDYCPSE